MEKLKQEKILHIFAKTAGGILTKKQQKQMLAQSIAAQILGKLRKIPLLKKTATAKNLQIMKIHSFNKSPSGQYIANSYHGKKKKKRSG
jgi:hypothetical protein